MARSSVIDALLSAPSTRLL